ncbi:MAG: hypothetical protein IJ190_05765 [Prevotella sp.]|nr:hypothetical protein [Prevotella sp.]
MKSNKVFLPFTYKCSLLMVFLLLGVGANYAQNKTRNRLKDDLTIGRVKNDLIGHRLSEGVENGYHEPDWTWTIKKGSISDFKVKKILEKSSNKVVFVATMKLSETYFSYDTTCKISYRRQNGQPWRMDYVKSMGMHVIVTHEYDDCIRASIEEDGWGGTYCLKLTNTSEMTLVAAGDVLTPNGWVRYARPIKGHEAETVGGLFGGGSVKQYRITFIVRKE